MFKILGLLGGTYLAGLSGAILGFIIGHAFDAGLTAVIQRKTFERQAKRAAEARFNQAFISSIYGMLSTLANSDGIVNNAELKLVHKVSTEYLKLNRHGKKFAMQEFNNAALSNRTFYSYAVEFYEATQGDLNMCAMAFNILLEMATIDGQINEMESRFLNSAADLFNINPNMASGQQQDYYYQQQVPPEYQSPPLQEPDCYEILGCNKTDSDETIKKRFRQLASEYHPDRIASKELAEDFINFANEKFRQIQAAYDTIKKERGIN